MEERFRQDALEFLVELCCQIRKRFPLSSDSVLAQLRVLDVDEAMRSDDKRTKSIIKLASQFPNVVQETDLDLLQDEWKALPSAKESLRNFTDFDPPKFWSSIKVIRDGNDQPKFGVLSDFMCTMIVLPHSSACVERVFSQVNIIKTPRTNRLQAETIASRLLAKQAIVRNDTPCYEWEPSKSLVQDMVKGTCHQRYIKRIEEKKRQCNVTVHNLNDGDGDDVFDNDCDGDDVFDTVEDCNN
jgi:hAT family C-terminal dimerisation region/N-terminal of Par3 and HAL proteins